MGFLSNKRILITGMISNRSIAYGIAIAMKREGAELAFTYQGEKVRDRVADLAKVVQGEQVHVEGVEFAGGGERVPPYRRERNEFRVDGFAA